jgi:hypothetical protein
MLKFDKCNRNLILQRTVVSSCAACFDTKQSCRSIKQCIYVFHKIFCDSVIKENRKNVYWFHVPFPGRSNYMYIYICLSFLCIFLFRSPNRNVVKLLFSLCMFSQSQTTTTVDITTFIESLVNTAWRISVFGQSLVSRARRLAMCNSFLVTTAWCISVSI